MRLVFAGTPEVAVPSLDRLCDAGHDVVAVVTRPDAAQGRRRVLTPSAVARAAAARSIPVWKAARIDTAVTQELSALRPDLGVVVAYGALIREPLLSTPVHGWINLHFSVLPRWRGAAPVQHALIAGDAVTGASVFALTERLDDGPVYATSRYEVPALATAGDVLDALSHRGAHLLDSVVGAIAAGDGRATAQAGEVTTAPKLVLDDARMRWDGPASQVIARWQGTTPEPGAFTVIADTRVKIIAMEPSAHGERLPAGRMAGVREGILIGTASDPVLITRVQPSGRGAMNAADWWRGLRVEEPVATW